MVRTTTPTAADDSGDQRLLTPAFVLLTVAGFFALAGFASTLPLVPRYVDSVLGGSKVEIGLALGAFSVSAVFARPLVGRLGDERGRRFIIVWGTTLTALMVAAHALASSIWLMYLARLGMGATQGAFFVGSATMVNDLAPPDRRGEATNYFSVAVYGGMAIGPLMGETVQRATSFGWAFAAGGISLLVAAVLASRLPDDRPDPAVQASHMSGTEGAGRRILLHRAAILPGLILMGGLVTFTALNGFMPLYVEEFDLGSAGPILLVYGLLVLVMRILGSKLPDRFGTLRMTVVSLVGQAAGMFVMGWWASQYGLYAGAAVLAIGGSFLYPTLLTAAVYRVPDHERTRAVSTFSLAFELSSGLGGPILGLSASAWGTQAAFYGAAIAALLSLPILLYWLVTQPDSLVAPR